MTNRMARWITTGERPALPAFVSTFAKAAASGGSSDDDPDDDDDDDPDADKSDEELRAELKSTRDALAKANGQSAKRRRALRQREAELEEARKPKPPKPEPKDGVAVVEPVDVDAIRREGEKAGLERAKRSEAKSALLAAGVSPERVAKAVGLLDLDELDLDDDGLDGIDEQIETLRKSWSELFARKRTPRQSVIGERDRDGSSAARKPKTASERAAAQLLGR
jgi:hypothetical protein